MASACSDWQSGVYRVGHSSFAARTEVFFGYLGPCASVAAACLATVAPIADLRLGLPGRAFSKLVTGLTVSCLRATVGPGQPPSVATIFGRLAFELMAPTSRKSAASCLRAAVGLRARFCLDRKLKSTVSRLRAMVDRCSGSSSYKSHVRQRRESTRYLGWPRRGTLLLLLGSLTGGAHAVGAQRREPRPVADLSAPAILPETLALRTREWASFLLFVAPLFPSEAVFLAAPLADVNAALVAYGQHLYDEQVGRYRLTNTLLALQDRRPDWCGLLGAAWRANRAWQRLEPTTPHVPMPRAVFLAMLSAAVHYQQFPFGVLLILGFVCLLRPGELLNLTRDHVLLPEDLGAGQNVIFVAIPSHKTVGQCGQQHVLLREPLFIAWIRAVIGPLPGHSRVFSGSPNAFRTLWDRLMALLHLGPLLTPASLRAGGATDLSIRGYSVADIQWRLRHASDKTCRHYIQEAGCALARARLTPAAQVVVRQFADTVIDRLRAGATVLPHAQSARAQGSAAPAGPRRARSVASALPVRARGRLERVGARSGLARASSR